MRGLRIGLSKYVADGIVKHPRRIVIAFLLVTAGFTTGLGAVSTETGTEQFTVGVPEEEALEDVDRRFTPAFETDPGSTQLIQRDLNVLAKPGLLRMLRAQKRLAERPALRVSSASSAARIVARELVPAVESGELAETLAAEIDAVERATPTEIATAVRAQADNPAFARLLSEDSNARDASASATIGIVEHDLPTEASAGAGQSGTSPLTSIQERAAFVVDSTGADMRVFGAGVIAAEFGQVVGDSLLVVVPAAVVLIVLFLVVAYRDPVDLVLGIVALGMTLVWTFGFMGLARIPFGQFLIAVPPLLLAIGIDFGIHSINRYREERVEGGSVGASMRRTADQLLVAFFLVTGTTVVGFAANLSSELVPIREFGLVSGIGVVFTFLVFGIFLPALKVEVDRLAEHYPIPRVSDTPLGGRGTALGSVLSIGVVFARRAPVFFLLVVLAGSALVGTGAADLDTGFSDEDFLPPERTPAYLAGLPEPFRPGEYTITGTTNFLTETFESAEDDTVTVLIEGPMERDSALETIHRAGANPPETFVRQGGRVESQSVVSVIRGVTERDPSFARLVAERDSDGNGIPDDDLEAVYEALLDSPAREFALEYVTEDRRSARVVYTVKADSDPGDVTADARRVADRHRYEATATGTIVVFQAIAGIIFESAVVSLALALSGAATFLLVGYGLLEGRPSLGIVNLVPIVVTVALIVGTMAALDIAFNAFTATVLAITIGLGVDYSVHIVHRFVDERRSHDRWTAIDRTVRGTGGALTGSVLTTAAGIGVLVLAIFPAIGQFGFLTATSVVYSFLASMLVLPSALIVWDRLLGPDPDRTDDPGRDFSRSRT